MKISNIILNSTNKEMLGSALSSLFDLDAKDTGYAAVLSGDFDFEFILIDSLEKALGFNQIIDFEFNSPDELHDLIQKIQFVNYRLSEVAFEVYSELTVEEGKHFFEAKDFDGRIWRFSSY